MAQLDFVDSHIHLYDMKHPELFYGHWQPGVPHPFLGQQIQKLAERNYFAEDYIAETRTSNVTKAIHIQSAIGSKDPAKETEWLQQAADRTGFPHGIIAHADLRDPGVESVLERHCQYPNMRGIRDFSYGDYLVEPDFHRGFALLKKYNLIAGMNAQWQDMKKLRGLAETFPNTVIVIDHAGLPDERSGDYYENWKKGMAIAAKAANIYCKISGLGLGDNNWTVGSIRPYVLYCIETFGIGRCLFASNWPVDWLFSSFDTVINAYNAIISSLSEDEQIALFSGNAENIYRV